MKYRAPQPHLAPVMPGNQQQPSAVEAERAVLGAAMLDVVARDVMLANIECGDFFAPASQAVFDALVETAEAGEASDAITVKNVLGANKLAAIGGVVALGRMIAEAAAFASVPFYCGVIRDKARLRDLASIGATIVSAVYSGDYTAMDCIDLANTGLLRVMDSTRANDDAPEVVTISEAVDGAAARLQERHDKQEETTGFTTGFPSVDRMIGGLRRKELTFLAGRPGMGKSTAVIAMLLNPAVAEAGVLWVSPEISRENAADKTLAHELNVNSLTFRYGIPSEQQIANARWVADILRERPVFLYDRAAPRVSHIAAKLREVKRRHPIGLLVVDHLLRLEPDDPTMPHHQQITNLVRSLGALCNREDCHGLIVTQLNRECESRGKDCHPMLSDLAASGTTEQDADNVMFVYREAYYLKDRTPADKRNVMELMVSKVRYGLTGTVEMYADLTTGRIVELAR